MYTEKDLRATLGALEHEAPEMARTLAEMERRRHRRTVRRRTVGMVTAAAVTVTLAAASFVLPGLLNGSAPSESVSVAKQHSEQWRFKFAVDNIPGHKVAYRQLVGTKWQEARVYSGNDTNHPLTLIVFAAGVYDPAAARQGEPVQVNGKSGFYRGDMPCQCSGGQPARALAWEYAPNAWALVQDESTQPIDPNPKGTMTIVAKAVRFDQTAPLRLPFRVGYLPSGLVPGQGDRSGVGWMNTMVQGSLGAGVDLQASNSPGVGLSIRSFGQPSDRPIGVPVVIEPEINLPDAGGMLLMGPSVVVNIGHSSVTLYSGHKDKPSLPIEELKKIAASITAAPDLNDSTTWFEAEQAIPIN